MSSTDPQFLYMILVLPSLFGLVLFGEGISRVLRNNASGVSTVILGLIFLGLVVFAYFVFSYLVRP